MNSDNKMEQRRILLYGDVNLNILDGSAIWLISMAQTLASTNSDVVLFLKAPITNDRLLQPLRDSKNVQIVEPFGEFVGDGNSGILTPRIAGRQILKMEREKKFDLIIARGFHICNVLAKGHNFDGRLWPYITDIPQKKGEFTEELVRDLRIILAGSRRMFTQTNQSKQLLESVLDESTQRLVLLNPMIPDEYFSAEGPKSAQSDPLRLVYAGKFHKDWRTLEMTELPRRMKAIGIDVALSMIGDKIQSSADDPSWADQMRAVLAEPPTDVHWQGALSRSDAIKEMAKHDAGLGWRTAAMDESHEISTKLLEYCAIGVPPIINRTFAHEKLLGKRYPLFVDSTIERTLECIALDPKLLDKARNMALPAARAYSISASAERLEGIFAAATLETIVDQPSSTPLGTVDTVGNVRSQSSGEGTNRGFIHSLRLQGFTSNPDELYESFQRLEDKLATAEANLETQQAEARALRDTLVNAQAAIATLSEEVSTGLNRASPKPGGSSPIPSTQPTKRKASVQPTAPTTNTIESLQNAFDLEPTARNLEKVLDHIWNYQGQISPAWRALDCNRSMVASMSSRGQRISRGIDATDRIRRNGIKIPPRTGTPVYVPERHRLLYTVHATPQFNSNGYATRTRGVASGLARAGKRVDVLGRPGYPWDSVIDKDKPDPMILEEFIDGVRYTSVPGPHLHDDALDAYLDKAADVIVHEARRRRPEIIQAASNYLTGIPALIAARRLGVPFVYEVRGLWELSWLATNPQWENGERFNLQVELETLLAMESDKVLAITPQVRDELVERGVPRSKITVVPNAVDTSEFTPALRDHAYGNELNISPDVPVVGFAGSIVEYEGLDVLLNAARILKDRNLDFEVVIAGDGKAFSALKALATELEIHDVVSFLGRVPVAHIPRLLSTFSIVTCPRTSMRVTELVSPLKPLEAMGAGRAVILSDVAPHRDIAGTDESRASLFKNGSPADLAVKLESLFTDHERRQNLARAGRLWAVKERNWNTIANELLDAQGDAITTSTQEIQLRGSKKLTEITIGLIADEHYTSLIESECNIVQISRRYWASQLENETFDILIIESGWNANDGEWNGGIGFFKDKENGLTDIKDLIPAAKARDIPVMFWNTSDPVYFERFKSVAKMADVVLTSDADLISTYKLTSESSATVASIPPFVNPKLHNPLREGAHISDNIAYSGFQFSAPLAKVKSTLEKLDSAIETMPLQIYGRGPRYHLQNNLPNSLKRRAQSCASLTDYLSVIKNHKIHCTIPLSPTSSTALPAEVVMAGACGRTVFLSSESVAATRFFGDNVPASSDELVWKGIAHVESTDPEVLRARKLELFRTIYRSHISPFVLTLMLRTAGISVQCPQAPSYAVAKDIWSRFEAQQLIRQTRLPVAIYGNIQDDTTKSELESAGITIYSEQELRDPITNVSDWIAYYPEEGTNLTEHYFEDLLHATLFGEYEQLSLSNSSGNGSLSAVEARQAISSSALVRAATYEKVGYSGESIPSLWLIGTGIGAVHAKNPVMPVTRVSAKTIVIAGHDFKFFGDIESGLISDGNRILTDKWAGHNAHDEDHSRDLLSMANVVFCEWGLGNSVWYARHLRPDQKLFVRVHSQEIFLPFLRQIEHTNVSAFIFVSAHIRDHAIRDHGLPPEKCIVIPNTVEVNRFDLPKNPHSEFAVGFVGIVPQIKRFDRALDIIEGLREVDERFVLKIKGKLPSDYPWMQNRPAELKWYERQFNRVSGALAGAVYFDEYGSDMPAWYQGVGYGLSVSDFESMHYTLVDSAAANSAPVGLAYPGADRVLPHGWLHSSIDDIVQFIAGMANDSSRRESYIAHAKSAVNDEFSAQKVIDQVLDLIHGRGAQTDREFG